MPIKNYKTSINSQKTITEIQQLLARHGAQKISIDFDADRNPVALSFLMLWDFKPIAYMLPCNFKGILRAMQNDKKVSRSQCTTEQALRVGWRILKDWVSAQMAIVEAEAATIPQIFLPYAVTNTGQTVYEVVESKKDSMLALPQ